VKLTQELGPGVKTVLGLVFAMVFAIPGAVLLVLGGHDVYQGAASRGWPTVEGEVIRSSVQSRRSGRPDRSQRVHSPDVVYSYRIGNELYTGDRIAFGGYSSSAGNYANRMTHRYPRGRQVSVHYQPGKPDNTVLEPGVSLKTWFKPAFGLVFLCAGLFIAWLLYKRSKASQ
jgi:hypothetical protein